MLTYIDTFEKALVFWLAMTVLTFLSIIVGMELGEFLGNFFQLSA